MTKPNIIYILADDMGYGDVSSLNQDSRIHTPHIDRIAREGLACTDAHSASAVCTPSRYSILTGRYNWRSSLKQGVLQGYDGPLIEAGRETVATLLHRHGYHSACVGKWHLGWDWPRGATDPEQTDPGQIDFTRPITNGPRDRAGFDEFFGIVASLDMPPFVFVENDLPTEVPDRIIEEKREGQVIWRRGPIAPGFTHEGVLPALADRACSYVERRAATESPFFLYLPLNSPHAPCLPTAEFQGRSGLNDYADFCLMTDAVVGRVLDTLAACGIEDNTIVVFTSDNGCTPVADFGALKRLGHEPSYVFRGHKADIYEGGHRIPFVVRWPDGIDAGRVCDETVCQVDLLATCAQIVGETLEDCAGEDSLSNLSLWQGGRLDTTRREATVHHSFDGSFSIRQGRWKLEFCPGSGGWSWPKPGQEPEGSPPIQLYDLDADIGERANVCSEHPDLVAHLTELMTTYVRNGRSTPGATQPNTGPEHWPQLSWMLE